jgi:hypothetical protein
MVEEGGEMMMMTKEKNKPKMTSERGERGMKKSRIR